VDLKKKRKPGNQGKTCGKEKKKKEKKKQKKKKK
jgi:hypothetical protein